LTAQEETLARRYSTHLTTAFQCAVLIKTKMDVCRCKLKSVQLRLPSVFLAPLSVILQKQLLFISRYYVLL